MFGLHANAEIGYLTTQGETLFQNILQVSGGSSSASGLGDNTAKERIDSFLAELPPNFNMIELGARVKDHNPYIVVCLQECERMNILLGTIRTSLLELDAGLKGQLNVTDLMEALGNSLSVNMTPAAWASVAYFSKKSLLDWFADALLRVEQL